MKKIDVPKTDFDTMLSNLEGASTDLCGFMDGIDCALLEEDHEVLGQVFNKIDRCTKILESYTQT